VGIHQILAETKDMLERSIDKRIEIKLLCNSESDVVMGDPSQIQNAFLNLAVNARDGTPAVFDRASGVPLVDAVAASCAVPGVWPPVTIGADRYIDGGARSYTNADFAAGCDPVLVVLPLEPGGRIAAVLDRKLAELRASAEVLLVRMDEHGRSAMGNNPLDPSTRHAMVAAGRAQSGDMANEAAALWK